MFSWWGWDLPAVSSRSNGTERGARENWGWISFGSGDEARRMQEDVA